VECASRVKCTRAEASLATPIKDYEAYEAAESGAKAFIEAVVEDTWICDLHDPETFYSNVTALELLNHLHDHSGGLHALDMVSLTIQKWHSVVHRGHHLAGKVDYYIYKTTLL
jgi:hypothetical protein